MPNEEEVITAEVTPAQAASDEEAPSNVTRRSSDGVDNAKPQKESCGWRVYYWVGMLSAFGLGAIAVFFIMKSKESSSLAIPDTPISDDLDAPNATDSGLPLLQESSDFPLQLCFGDCDTDVCNLLLNVC